MSKIEKLEKELRLIRKLVKDAKPFARHVSCCMNYAGWQEMSEMAEKWLDKADSLDSVVGDSSRKQHRAMEKSK